MKHNKLYKLIAVELKLDFFRVLFTYYVIINKINIKDNDLFMFDSTEVFILQNYQKNFIRALFYFCYFIIIISSATNIAV